MKRSLPGRMLFFAVYLSLALGFLAIHLTRVEGFNAVVGGIVVKGRTTAGTPLSPQRIRRLSIEYGGAVTELSAGSNVVLITDDGIRHRADIRSWREDGNVVTLELEKGASLRFSADPHGTGIEVVPQVPETSPPVRSVEIPFLAASGATIAPNPDRPEIVEIIGEGFTLIAGMPEQSYWNAETQKLSFYILDQVDPVLSIGSEIPSRGLSAREWHAQGNIPGASVYQQSVDGWLNTAYQGWLNRQDVRTGLWPSESGGNGWSDQIAAAVLAEATSRGQAQGSLSLIQAGAARVPSFVGWLTSPYLGNIVAQTPSMIRSLSTEAAAMTTIPFSPGGGLSVAIDVGNTTMASAVLQEARTALGENVSQVEALARLKILQEAHSLGQSEGDDTTRRRQIIEESLLPSVAWVMDGLWLFDDEGAVDVGQSLSTGLALLKESSIASQAMYRDVGRQLVLSALYTAGTNGILPARVYYESEGDVVTEGQITPENLYVDLIDNPYYPRRIPLTQELGEGSWALTSVERFTLRSTPRETTINMDFPAQQTHHMAIRGIKPFVQLYMNGIRWNGDPNFQRYYAGWYYDGNTETLYVKMRHRTATETIRILYYNPDSATEAAAGN